MKVAFEKSHNEVVKLTGNSLLFEDTYVVNLEKVQKEKHVLLASMINESVLWRRRLGHANMSQTSKLSKKELAKGLPKVEFVKDNACETCQARKHPRISIKRVASPQQILLTYVIWIYLDRFHQLLSKVNPIVLLLWMITHGILIIFSQEQG